MGSARRSCAFWQRNVISSSCNRSAESGCTNTICRRTGTRLLRNEPGHVGSPTTTKQRVLLGDLVLRCAPQKLQTGVAYLAGRAHAAMCSASVGTLSISRSCGRVQRAVATPASANRPNVTPDTRAAFAKHSSPPRDREVPSVCSITSIGIRCVSTTWRAPPLLRFSLIWRSGGPCVRLNRATTPPSQCRVDCNVIAGAGYKLACQREGRHGSQPGPSP